LGGPHNQALLLAREVRRLGLSMSVILPKTAESAFARLPGSGVDVVTMPLHHARDASRDFRDSASRSDKERITVAC
jgi:hypothetical protein